MANSKKLKLQAVDDKIICIAVEEKAKSGFLLSTPEEAWYSEVVSVGPNVLEVEVGDLIVFDRQAADYATLDGVQYIITREPDVVGTMMEEAE